MDSSPLRRPAAALGIVGAALLLTAVALVSFGGAAKPEATPAGDAGTPTLDEVRARGYLRCGVEGGLSSFGEIRGTSTLQQGKRRFFTVADGFDADFCRVVATAVFGTYEEHLYFTPIHVDERFDVLVQGEIDLLVRNTTWTGTRDTGYGVDFGPVIFHDGQKFLVPRASGIDELSDLDRLRICVLPKTTTYRNTVSILEQLGITYTLVVERRPDESFLDTSDLVEAYLLDKCDAMTSDESQLLARRSQLPNLGDHKLIPPNVVSYEPLAPAISEGDDNWHDIVNYAIWATIHAEFLGINSTNVDEFTETGSRTARRFLGRDVDEPHELVGASLGLEPDFTYRIIVHVGNYAEIYSRNLDSIITDRGPNQVWELDREGRLFSPPFSP